MTTELINTGGTIIAVDIVQELQAELSAETSDYATEIGETRSDNKIHNPAIITIQVRQTEKPIDAVDGFALAPLSYAVEDVRTVVTSPFLLALQGAQAVAGAIGGALGLVKKPKQMETLQASDPKDRGGELFAKLLELWQGNDVSDVTFKGRTYPSMQLIGLTLSDTMAGLTSYQLTFKEERRASTQRVALPNPADIALKPPATDGKQTGSGGTEAAANAAQTQSALVALGKGTGVLQ